MNAFAVNVGWIHSDFFARHIDANHRESPQRLEAIVEALADAGLLNRMKALPFEPARTEDICLIHEPAYVALVELACEEGMTFLGSRETRIGRESCDVARWAVGGVLAACDAVGAGAVNRAFCAVRPPGHHAERDQAMGYCLLNNVAIAAEFLIRNRGLKRVAIVDWDVHHGNGTQHAFEHRDDVFYISLHEGPDHLYPHSGYAGETGRDAGKGYTLNIPMRPGSGDREYRQAFQEKVVPRLDMFRPEFILVSAGFDGVCQDTTSDINLHPASFEWMTRALIDVADRHAGGRLVSVLEGGYDLPSLGRCVEAHIRAMLEPV